IRTLEVADLPFYQRPVNLLGAVACQLQSHCRVALQRRPLRQPLHLLALKERPRASGLNQHSETRDFSVKDAVVLLLRAQRFERTLRKRESGGHGAPSRRLSPVYPERVNGVKKP